MTFITERLMRQLVPAIGPDNAANWARALSDACVPAGITTRRQVNHWLAQLAHESAGFTRFEENLSYSAARMVAVWPSRFPNAAAAKPFARNPQALANRVYNGRMGNRAGSDDGWYFRGRGPKQLTGRDNYTAFQRWLTANGLQHDVIRNPALVTTPTVGALSAAWFWNANGLNRVLGEHASETAAVEAVTRRINGGTVGLADRKRWFNLVRTIPS